MIKSIKVRLNPNNKQLTKLFQYAGSARFAYNWAINKEEENYKQGNKFLSDNELRKEFTQLKKLQEYKWLNEISNNVTKQAIKDACNAYKNFFKGQSKFPKFKSRKHSIPSFYQDNVKIQFTDTHVKVEAFSMSKKQNKQKLNWIKLYEKRKIPTDCKYLNPRFTYDGLYWYVSVSIEVDDNTENTPPLNEGIGIDLGIKDLAVCSDGNTYKNINKTQRVKKLEKKKRRLQRSVSRKYDKNKKGGNYCKTSNIIKREKELLKTSKRLTNIRHDYIHQTTSEIIKRKPSFICIEDLKIKDMVKNKQLSFDIMDCSWYELRRQLEYKAKFYDKKIHIVDRYFPSSKKCSVCDYKKEDLTLNDRFWTCPNCGTAHDRDINAAKNILKEGMKN